MTKSRSSSLSSDAAQGLVRYYGALGPRSKLRRGRLSGRGVVLAKGARISYLVNVDRFEEAVREKEAEAKGTQDSVESNPDEVLRKAKDEYRNRGAEEELERRKKELAEKNKGA